MGFEVAASLAVAALDLHLVKSIRAAIRAADAASGKQFPVTAIGPSPNPKIVAERVLHPTIGREPTPTIEPRRVFHPTPRYEPRPVIHPEQRVGVTAPECTDFATPINTSCDITPSPIQPPWKQLPWLEPACCSDEVLAHIPRHPKIKHTARHVDMGGKGIVIDLFI